MARVSRSLYLTPTDQGRVKELVARSGLDISTSGLLAAAVAHYKAQLPLDDDAVAELNNQLLKEDAGDAGKKRITSFSMHDHEAAELDELVKNATLTRRFSVNALVRLALLMFSFAVDDDVRTTCLALPPRPQPGRQPGRIKQA